MTTRSPYRKFFNNSDMAGFPAHLMYGKYSELYSKESRTQ